MAAPRKLYLLVPLVYVAVIAGFLLLQFGGGTAFSQKVSTLEASGVRDGRSAAEGYAIRRITLTFGTTEFRFSRFRPVLLGESRHRLRPVSFSTTADAVSVDFRGFGGRSLTLVFRVEQGSGALEITAGTEEPIALPMECPGGRVETSDAVPALGISSRGETLVAILPRESRLGWAGGYAYLSGPVNRMRLTRSEGGGLLLQWLLAQGSLASDDAYRREVAAFRDRAYLGWARSRYMPEIGLWRGSDGQPGYTDRLGTAFLAEALSRGEYDRVFAIVARAEDAWMRARPTSSLSHETGPFTGDVESFAVWRLETEGPDAREAERLLRAASPSAWRTPALVRNLRADGADAVLAEAGQKSLVGWDPEATDVATALGVLEGSLDESLPGSGSQAAPWLTAAADRALARIFASLRIDGETLGVVVGDSVDAASSLRAGALLVRAGSARQNQTLSGLGRTLIATVLRSADPEGFVAARRGIGAVPGRLAPEEVYQVARLSPYLPEVRPLGQVLGAGVWLWSAAPLKSVTAAGGEVTLTFTFVPGVPHTILIRGLAPFQQIRLKGIPWRPDPAYARYFAGWFYDADKRSLVLKLTQDQGDEQVVITR